MDWLNYHHLYYFAAIAREGGISPAARKLGLTHSTLSAQLRALEDHFAAPLFERRGKRLVLTPFGADAAGYAEDIFRLGGELNEVARGRAHPGRDVLRVGLVADLPKTLAHHLLAPALEAENGKLSIRQDSSAVLLDALLAGRLHVVLCNEVPVAPPGAKFHSHRLGATDILLYARAPLAQRARKDFPSSLSKVPFVLPGSASPLRRQLDAWFLARRVRPSLKAEIDDAGLLRVFGSAGRGVFPVRAALKAEVEDLRDVQLVAACEGVSEVYYAISIERRIRHPGVAAIVDRARAGLNETVGKARSGLGT